MTDFSQMLLDQLKQNNLAQTNLANDYTKQANLMANMPKGDPMNSFMGALGMGVAGAPSNVGTLEAIGRAFPAAQGAYEQSHQNNMNRQLQSLEFKKLAASTLDAVAKFNLEYGLKRDELASRAADRSETARHHKATEYKDLLALSSKPTQNQEMAKAYLLEKLKHGQLARDNKDKVSQQTKAAKNATGLFNTGFFRNRAAFLGAGEGVDPRYRPTGPGDYKTDLMKAEENEIVRVKDELIADYIQDKRSQGLSDEEIKNDLERDQQNINLVAEQTVRGKK